MTSRGFESIYRIAEAFARLMLKNVIDVEVVEQTINFVSAMYSDYGAEIAEIPDYRTYVYLGIAKVVKEHSQNILWVQEQDVIGSDELDDITFNEAAEIFASKDQKGRHYLRNNFRSSNNRAARHLREMFREERVYEGGRIKVVSTDKHAELKLTWAPNASSTEEPVVQKGG
jgi:DNA replicative helicase MCM subunit Mcm2 (Cdc46/Mcm family)